MLVQAAVERTMTLQIEKREGFTFTAGPSIGMTLMNPAEIQSVHVTRFASHNPLVLANFFSILLGRESSVTLRGCVFEARSRMVHTHRTT
jgi:hypothetical protein